MTTHVVRLKSDNMCSQDSRRWAGVSLAARQDIRRGELLQAGVDLLGAPEGPAVSVRAVCRAARMTERYFYDSFTDRAQFVESVYRHVAEQARDALLLAVATADTPVERARAAVTAFTTLILDRPAMGRVLLIAPMTESALGGTGLETAPGFALLVQAQLTSVPDPNERTLVATGMVGALASLFIGYLDGTITVSRERFVDHCVELLEHANRPRSSQA